ncbi:hypothetical protein [Dyella choica]|uniref:Uncharacterized protein n=1 Tax=Dyella choica TaxID=1927959 RepID=A0A432LZR5_9GAMM|nr:hypothetical protein [Dyella choica]RUL69315.1 hypothetical protein EKH80_22585 [Dyella choica]
MNGPLAALKYRLKKTQPETSEAILITLHGTPESRALMANTLKSFVALIGQAQRRLDLVVQRKLVEFLTPAPPSPPLNTLRRLDMMHRARQFALDSSE